MGTGESFTGRKRPRRRADHILIMKANEMHYFSNIYDKVLYVFRTGPLSIIRSLNTVFTAIGICHASYVDSLLAESQHN